MISTRNQDQTTIAAIFFDHHRARTAMRELHRRGYRRAWMGIIRDSQIIRHRPVVATVEGGGVFASIGRFFGGEGDRTLDVVLQSKGIPAAQARMVSDRVGFNSVVLTVDIEEAPERALEIIESHGGDVQGAAFADRPIHAGRETAVEFESLFL